MKPWERKIAPLGFFLAGVLFVVAAILPTLKGRPLNAAFLPIGIVFAILGGIAWSKSKGPEPPAS